MVHFHRMRDMDSREVSLFILPSVYLNDGGNGFMEGGVDDGRTIRTLALPSVHSSVLPLHHGRVT